MQTKTVQDTRARRDQTAEGGSQRRENHVKSEMSNRPPLNSTFRGGSRRNDATRTRRHTQQTHNTPTQQHTDTHTHAHTQKSTIWANWPKSNWPKSNWPKSNWPKSTMIGAPPFGEPFGPDFFWVWALLFGAVTHTRSRNGLAKNGLDWPKLDWPKLVLAKSGIEPEWCLPATMPS